MPEGLRKRLEQLLNSDRTINFNPEDEIEKIINILSNQDDAGNQLIEVIKLAILELELRSRFGGDIIELAFQRLIKLPEERVNDNVVGALREPQQFFYCSRSLINLDEIIENKLKIYENSIESARVKAVLAEIRQKEELKEKEDFYELLRKINIEENEPDDSFSGISLSPTRPINYNGYDQKIIDDDICYILSQIAINEEAAEKNRINSAKILAGATWPQETLPTFVAYLENNLTNNLPDEVYANFVEGMREVPEQNRMPLINFPTQGEVSVSMLLLNRLKRDYQGNSSSLQPEISKACLRKAIVEVFSEINVFTEEHVFFFLKMLRSSDIIKNNYSMRITPYPSLYEVCPSVHIRANARDYEIEAHCQREDSVVVALRETLRRCAERQPQLFAEVAAQAGIGFFQNSSEEVKLSLVDNLTHQALLQLFVDNELTYLQNKIAELNRIKEKNDILSLVTKAFFDEGNFDHIANLLNEAEITNEEFISFYISCIGLVGFPLFPAANKLINNPHLLLTSNHRERLAQCCIEQSRKHKDTDHQVESAMVLLLLNKNDTNAASLLAQKLFNISCCKKISEFLSKTPPNKEIIETLQNSENLEGLLWMYNGQSDTVKPFLINLCKHAKYKDLVLNTFLILFNKFKDSSYPDSKKKYIEPILYAVLAEIDLKDSTLLPQLIQHLEQTNGEIQETILNKCTFALQEMRRSFNNLMQFSAKIKLANENRIFEQLLRQRGANQILGRPLDRPPFEDRYEVHIENWYQSYENDLEVRNLYNSFYGSSDAYDADVAISHNLKKGRIRHSDESVVRYLHDKICKFVDFVNNQNQMEPTSDERRPRAKTF